MVRLMSASRSFDEVILALAFVFWFAFEFAFEFELDTRKELDWA